MKRRNFIRNATIGSIALSWLTGTIILFTSKSKLIKGSKLKDNFWLLDQNAGVHHGTTNPYKLPGKNIIESRKGCDFFGLEKYCQVAMDSGPFPPINEEAK